MTDIVKEIELGMEQSRSVAPSKRRARNAGSFVATLPPEAGTRFGLLVVLGPGLKHPKSGHSTWRCACDCGRQKDVVAAAIRRGKMRSCGCEKRRLLSERRTKHGQSDTPEHMVWSSMKARCSNPNGRHFDRYGGRGIRVCDRWAGSYELFMADMGPKPGPGFTVERIDNDGNYEPGNCRWATQAEQTLNKSNTRFITALGVTMPLAEWARKTGFRQSMIGQRLKNGWDPDRAVTEPSASATKRSAT